MGSNGVKGAHMGPKVDTGLNGVEGGIVAKGAKQSEKIVAKDVLNRDRGNLLRISSLKRGPRYL